MMKITPDTKIKDIIPDGWKLEDVEFDPPVYLEKSLISNIGQVCIPLVKKSEKDFLWYAMEYYDKMMKNFTVFTGGEYIDAIGHGKYIIIPFELRIGLLKYICDYLGIGLLSMYYYLRNAHIDDIGEAYKDLHAICPKEFIHSLID